MTASGVAGGGGAVGDEDVADADELPAWVPVGDGWTTLQVGRRGPVGWLVFDRPRAGNALDAAMFDELERAWPALADDPEVRVIVNTGAGRAFHTGLDVVQLAREPEALRTNARRTRDAELRFTAWHLGIDVPVIAAVNGTCAGGGLHFVADADLVVCAAGATFLDPHVSVGQAVAFEGIALARKSPMESVVRMALTGRHERLGAERARQLGLCSQVVDPPERLRAEAQALGERIAANDPAALAASKRLLWAALEVGYTDALRAAAAEEASRLAAAGPDVLAAAAVVGTTSPDPPSPEPGAPNP